MKFNRYGWLVVGVALAGGFGFVVRTQDQSESDVAEIRAARTAQNAAIAALDLDSVASFWTPGIVVTAGLGFVLQGRDTYRRAFEQDSTLTYQRNTVDISVNEVQRIAWERGNWTGSPVSDPTRPLLEGEYSAQWVNLDGRWRIRSELFVALRCSGAACRWNITAH